MKKSNAALLDYHQPLGESSATYYPQAVSPGASSGLTPILAHVLSDVRRELSQRRQQEEPEASNEVLRSLVIAAAREAGFSITHFERDEILLQLEKDAQPFGILQSLVDDERVSDIIVRGPEYVAVQQGRKNYLTDIRFPTHDELEGFIERLLLKAGTSFSTKKPIADGMVGSARIHAVHACISEQGPYLTIRLNRFSTVNLTDLVNVELAPSVVLHYLSCLVRSGQTVFIAGEVGTGKTTLARALGNSIPDHESILVIEDTPEIKLHHPHVRYMTTRESNTDGAGRVTPGECIRGGMRMAMNRIIFGEIRDAEAAESFIDVCASGHPGLSTIHGRSASEAVSRLELFLGRAQRGVDEKLLKEQVGNAVQCVVHIGICKVTEKRRILEVRELGPVADGVLRFREIFKYQISQGVPQWKITTRVSAHRELIEEGDDGVILSALPSVLVVDIPESKHIARG